MTSAAVTVAAGTAPDLTADRLLRVFAEFIACGYGIYFLLMFSNGVLYAPQFEAWWTPAAMIAVFGTGMWLVVDSVRWNERRLRRAAAVAASAYLAVVFTGFAAWTGPPVLEQQAVWPSHFPAVAALAALVAWGPAVSAGYLVVATTSVQMLSHRTNTVNDGLLIQDIVFATVFCAMFLAAAAMALRTGRILDETREASHAAAAAAAAAAARATERKRVGALVHDQVLATLLAVDRQGATPTVRRSAGEALEHLDDLREDRVIGTDLDADHFLAYLRSAATGIDDAIAIRADVGGASPVPADVVRIMAQAMAEAVRNSVRHAGDGATRSVYLTIDRRQVQVTVVDDGRGFDPETVAPHRLGLRVSIHGRMAGLPGGGAHIESAPGQGTRVTLEWRPA